VPMMLAVTGRPCRILAAVIACLIVAEFAGACRSGVERTRQTAEFTVYPPAPQNPHVVALGNLRGGAPPTNAQVKWSLFLFGDSPDAPLAFVRPISVSLDRNGLWVCDAAMGAVVHWREGEDDLTVADLSPRPFSPVATAVTPNGDLLVADAKTGTISRYDPQGRMTRTYRLPPEDFRPGGLLLRGDEIWVSNVIKHRLEIFDGATAEHRRSIGGRGGGAGEFGVPLGMAATPDGNICIVDMLNARVQVLDGSGKHVRDVGGPGDIVGRFGRPKDVAVGPDGTIFVTDAATQRVHAFNAEGQALLAFGEPSDGLGSLSVPGGICISHRCPLESPALPADFPADYYVLVAEQLLRPGIRVFAWRSPGRTATEAAGPATSALALASGTVNPHWSAAQCNECHVGDAAAGKLKGDTDQLCLSCHDGKKARAEPHPIARLASTAHTTAPKGWPLVEGRLVCLSCHDIVRHCDPAARRPAINPAMLRVHDPEEPLRLCTQCHQASDAWRVSPHRNLDAAGQVIASSCAFCHVQTPPTSPDGSRTGDALLHADGSSLCLTCHARHWDVSPLGHVDREASDLTRRIVAARPSAQALPLHGDRVTCYSCHNPHQAGLFPLDSPLGAISTAPADTRAALRVSSAELCLQCHAK
jgi:predicted CXXCH cytochrome family protein